MKNLNFTFKGYDKIEKSFSQSFQDLFVLSVLNGKTKGTFLEIGASDPTIGSNTYVLETLFDWSGISIDCLDLTDKFKTRPKSKFIMGDAINLNYNDILKDLAIDNRVDYLQLDIDPNENTLKCLQNLPLDKYRFSTITYEHDNYRPSASREHNDYIRTTSREIFKQNGYELIFKDVCNFLVSVYGIPDIYEDWYVDPQVVSKEIIDKMKRTEEKLLTAYDYIFKNLD